MKFKSSIAILFTVIFATTIHAQYRSDSCGCPIPQGDTGGTFTGRNIPNYANTAGYLSPNGRWLTFGDQGAESYVLNLNTLEKKHIVINAGFPGEVEDWGGGAPIWCPYDSDVVALMMTFNVDTSNNGQSSVRVQNLFTYRISTGEATRITPAILGKYGPPGMGSVLSWLPSSSPGKDSLIIGYSAFDSPIHQGFYGIFVPQTQALIPIIVSAGTDTMARSRDGKHSVSFNWDTLTGIGLLPYYFDDKPLDFPHELDTIGPGIQGVTFSPDGSLVAYWVFPMGCGAPADSIFDQVWVCKTSDPANIIDVINFQCCFCTYSFWGIWPEFITDSTLAVSMHKDEDESSPMWEISIHGCNIVRQLTFLPVSDVKDGSLSTSENYLRVFPNPAAESITVEGASGRVTISDPLGRSYSLPTTPQPPPWKDGGVTIDISLLPSGVYFVSDGVSGAKFVKE